MLAMEIGTVSPRTPSSRYSLVKQDVENQNMPMDDDETTIELNSPPPQSDTPVLLTTFEDNQLHTVDTSVAIVGLVTFVGDAARGILFPVLWPLCESLGGSHVHYGE